VAIILLRAWFLLFFMRAWWDHVTDTPDEIRIRVFKRGTLMGLNLLTLFGGHICPISMFGDALSWKYAQKNLKKNITSEVINKSIPIFSPVTTTFWWRPSFLASLNVSTHHVIAVIIVNTDVIFNIIAFGWPESLEDV